MTHNEAQGEGRKRGGTRNDQDGKQMPGLDAKEGGLVDVGFVAQFGA